ncbi:MAG TPA: SPASM domain-containing protein, partial [Spirochaetia bacterium]|nr:SPASM domain-containing protein [Spirochaetia bacterium]
YHQYIPCVEFDAKGQLLPYTITGEQWGHFLCGIFSEWIKKDTERVSVRLFDSILTMLVDGYANVCSIGTNCCQYFVVEHNGDVYPCDFFVEKKLRLGNIMENSWDEFLASPTYLEFGERKSDWSPECRDCPWVGFCAGDCPKQRFYGVEDPHQLSHLCQGWKMFYQKTLPEFKRLAREIKERRARTAYPSLTPTPIKVQGRNEPCLCGSGKKYKYCHGT